MRRSGVSGGLKARTGFAALGARLSLIAVTFALVAQMLAFGAGGLRTPDSPVAAAAQLSALLGGPVVVCAQEQAPGAPHDNGACHAGCPLCRLADQLATLAPPDALPTLAPPTVAPTRPRLPPDAAPVTAVATGFSLARGPPVAM